MLSLSPPGASIVTALTIEAVVYFSLLADPDTSTPQ